MTIAETGEIMDILEAAYPRFYSGERNTKTLSLWATMFADYPLTMVSAAVREFIATDTKGFPPVIGQIMSKIKYDPVRAREIRKNTERLRQICIETDEMEALEMKKMARLEEAKIMTTEADEKRSKGENCR